VNATHCVSHDGSPMGRALLICDVTDERAAQVRLTQAMADRFLCLTDTTPPSKPLASLTQQELRILRLVGQGLGNSGIAEAVGISEATVRSHLKTLYRKLSLTSRAAAVSYAVHNRLA
jgi:DNA-binding NarL/FixJ family response regulator